MNERGLQWLQLPSGAAALIDPSRGGTVHRLRFAGDFDDDRWTEPIEILRGDRDEQIIERDDPDIFRGRILAPFADRIRNGRYRFAGEDYTLDANDGESGDAIHGFLYRTRLGRTGVDVQTDVERTMTLNGVLPPQTGYPWSLAIRISYILRDREFVLRIVLTNESTTGAPVTIGWHPYFVVPGVSKNTPIDRANLMVPAANYFEIDSELQPTGDVAPVEGTALDFRRNKPIGSTEIDHGFPVRRDADNVPLPIVLDGPGHRLSISMRGAFGATQVFIPPSRDSIAIEPISAPAEAFNKPHLGLIVLGPGESVEGTGLVSLRSTTENR